jgi:HPt (histidine-containing phosphotransfer) domain-containing protein
MLMHTNKGIAATLGLNPLAAKLRNIELACHAESLRPGDAQCDGLLELIEAARRALDGAVALLGGTQTQEVDRPPEPHKARESAPLDAGTRQLLAKLCALLERSDLEVLQLFSEQRDVLGTLAEHHLSQLEDAMQELDFQRALTICNDVLEAA